MMHRSVYIKICTILLAIVCVLGACAGSPDTSGVPGADIGLTAEPSPDGIRLMFSGIPRETSRMFVNVSTWSRNEAVSGTPEIVSSFTDIRDGALESVKAGGTITVPFVRSGERYDITVFCEGENEPEAWSTVECVAGGGIYYKDGLSLALNETETAVTLSADPVFSREVQYAPGKYRYGVTVLKESNWSIGVGDENKDDSLTWVFQPLVNEDLAASGYLESGDYPAYATAYCKAVYDELTWFVELAKSGEFTLHL